MRIKRQALVVLLAVSGCFLIPTLAMAKEGAAKTKADHLALVEKYDKMAADQEALVQEHTAMKQDYRSGQATLPKQTREKSLAEMDKHCDAIIGDAKKLASEYKAMAQWHKLRAAELE